MQRIITADESGALLIPRELSGSKPNEEFEVSIEAGRIVLAPKASTTRGKPLQRFFDVVASLPVREGPEIPDEALRRVNLYD